MTRSLVTARPAGTARPRIEEVAVAASVSTATVSRGPNGQTVREPMRTRIACWPSWPNLATCRVLARALTLHRTDTVGAILPAVENAIVAKAIEALQQRLGEDGLQLPIARSGYDTKRAMPFRSTPAVRGRCGIAR